MDRSASPQSATGRTGELARLRALARFFVPEDLPDDANGQLRAEMLAGMDLAFLAIAALVGAAVELLIPHPGVSGPLTRLLLLCVALGLTASLLVLRNTGRLGLAVNLCLFSAFCTTFAGCALQGGFASPSLAVFLAIPVAATLLSGRGAGFGWGVAVVCAWSSLFALTAAGFDFPNRLGEAGFHASRLLNLLIAAICTVGAVVLYETMNRRLRQTLASERAQFQYEAGHDPLTGIANRRRFSEHLDAALRRAERTKKKVALATLDLNRFKPINDRFGHAVGDEVLRALARRLQENLRATDLVARVGGDEFSVTVEFLASRDDAAVAVSKITQALSRPLILPDGSNHTISAATGVALYPDDGAVLEELTERADAAMYAAKHSGVPLRFATPEETD